jgi:tetratricopeptide (TPR) repeat protein
MVPSPSADPNQVATSIVTWSGFVLAGFSFLLTVFTAFVLLAGLFGLRELRNIRKAGQEVGEETKKILNDANTFLLRLQNEVASIDGRMNSLVEVSYLFNQGELAYRAGEYLRAVDYLGRAILLDPKNARVLYRLGRAMTNAGDDAAAPERFKEMKLLGEHSGDPERGLAWVYRYTNPGQALRHAEKASSVDPVNHQNWNCLGILQRDDGDILTSLKSHERAADLEPKSVVTPFFLSLLRARQGSEERARSDCSAAVYQLRAQEQRSPVKSIWADLILWADRVLAGDYDGADRLSVSLAASCTSRRRAREVGGHMDFLLRSLHRESFLTRYLGPVEQRWPPQPGE